MTGTSEYGVDLITFYHPSFWGVGTHDDLLALRRKDPSAIWTRIFDALAEAGITAIELTFPPADMACAIEAFGSARGFRRELDLRGLHVKSGFHVAFGWAPGADVSAEVDAAIEYAEFLAAAGGDTLVVGPPLRRTRDARPPLFIDLPFASAVADVAHAVGDATLRAGVRTAVHTEAHSMLCTRRDVDLLMTITDPEYVFLCPDTAHITLSGSDPVETVSAHRERVVIAHWKDAVGPMPSGMSIDGSIHVAHRQYMCALGSGVVDWPAWAALYDRTAGRDVRLLELDAVPDPVAEMRNAKAFATDIGV